MAKAKKKSEALSVSRLINEVLVLQLSIPFRQIVNDTTFATYTGSKRPDILISEFEYDGTNDKQYIENLVAYAEAKDNCSVNDRDWKDAIAQAKIKSEKLKLPYFIITNCKTTIFYNAHNLNEIRLNGNPLREFQTIDILRLLKTKLLKNKTLTNILTNVDSISTISESIFNKKLWELASIYRGISFKNNNQKIDFTIGFIALEFFEEKAKIENTFDSTKINWSTCDDDIDAKLVGNLSQYITRLEQETSFKEFKNLMEIVNEAINSKSKTPLVSAENTRLIYNIINSMSPLHGTGFDLFGAVYEHFASSKEKKDFGEYFTRRHYAHIFSKLLLKDIKFFHENKKFKIADVACGTGGFLTESFKVVKNSYKLNESLTDEATKFLSEECFYGFDVREENIARAKLNMFLVGDGHTHIIHTNTLTDELEENFFDYIITNPPYGTGTTLAETTALSTSRLEIAFLIKIIKLLNAGGKACIIIPDGIFENPSYQAIRQELLEKCTIDAIISLPKFAFAPYTKEKTYALFITKRNTIKTAIQKTPIWFYIIDNDGLANSDKRFHTKLRNNRNGWKHDELSGWVSTDGEEREGILESRWLKFDDSETKGTEWITEKNEKVKMRKGGFIDISQILNDKYMTLLPEYYLRPYEPSYIDLDSLKKEIKLIDSMIKELL
jgi:type I restriction-modification system DNA methylase subunit